MPAWFWYNAFLHHFTTQSPLPSRLHSWLPSLLTLPWLPYTSFLPSFFSPPPFSFLLCPHILSSSPYSSNIMPVICPYCCTISSYTGFVIHNDAYDVMLGLHHNAEMYISPAAVFCSPWLPLTTTTISIFARQHIFSSTVSFSNWRRRQSRFAWSKRAFHCDVTAAMWYSLLICQLKSLCDLFLPVIQSQAVEEHDSLGNTPFQNWWRF